MKVYLSPSDQWSNIVADGEHSEAYHCKQICDSAKKYLEMNGYTCYVGANDKEGSYPNRVTESNNVKADLHIPVHTNAGGGEGTLVMCYPNYSANKYVKSVYTEVANLTPTKDKGIQETTSLYEINETTAVCIYIEVDFHDNKNIENWIDSNIDEIGRAIAKGICKADNRQFVDTNSYSNSTGLYKVQVGAFLYRENAERLAEKLKGEGYATYIVRS